MQGCASFSRHVPFVHVSLPAGQTLPHVPQFALSVANDTQLPLQPLWPAAQQIPLVQLLLGALTVDLARDAVAGGSYAGAAVPQTVPAAVQVPPAPPQQG